MKPVNERLQDALLRRAALNSRAENATLRDLLVDWRRAVQGMVYAVRSRGDIFTKERALLGFPAADRHSRLQREVLSPLRALIDAAMDRMARRLALDLPMFVRRELMDTPEILQRIADAALPEDGSVAATEAVFSEAVGVTFDSVPTQQIAVLLATPAGGSFFQTGLERLGQQLFGQARGVLLGGLIQGRGVDPVARQLQGVLGGARWQAERIVRSEYVRSGNQADLLTFEKNKRLLDGVRWLSTLDRKTCAFCAALDGRVFKDIAKAKIPVQDSHPSCRCKLIPIVKSSKALGLPPGTRASFTGQVPATVTYKDWLPQQSAAFQREVLGPTRYRLWKSGALKLGDFVTAAGIRPVSALIDKTSGDAEKTVRIREALGLPGR